MKAWVPRVSVQRFMVIVAAAAILLGIVPRFWNDLQCAIWHGSSPQTMRRISLAVFLPRPRLDFAVIPALCFVVALEKPRRWMVWTAFFVGALAIVEWVFIRRPLGVGPGGVMFWPDYFSPILQGTLPYAMSFSPLYRVFMPSTWSEAVDLLSLTVLLACLVSFWVQTICLFRRMRALTALVVVLAPCREWVARMLTKYNGVNWSSLSGAVGHDVHPATRTSVGDYLQGIALIALITYLIIASGVSIAKGGRLSFAGRS
jgi:hypothetical protein